MSYEAHQNEILVTDLSTLEINDVIRISDGTKQPPKHHTKKLSRWTQKNQTALFHGLEHNNTMIKIKDKPDPIMVHWVSLDGLQVFKQVPTLH